VHQIKVTRKPVSYCSAEVSAVWIGSRQQPDSCKGSKVSFLHIPFFSHLNRKMRTH